MPAGAEFDLIVMKHVIEHIADPLSVLRRARAALDEGGFLFVAVPTLDQLHRHGKKGHCLNRAHHVTAYTRRSLRQLLSRVGFTVLGEMPTGLPQRLAFLASARGTPATVRDPLRDARRALRRHAIKEYGVSVLLRPLRARAAAANASVLADKRAKGMRRVSEIAEPRP